MKLLQSKRNFQMQNRTFEKLQMLEFESEFIRWIRKERYLRI